MTDPKSKVDSLILRAEKGEMPPERAWNEIRRLKDEYVRNYNEQSWHVFIGHKFQKIVHSILEGYLKRLKPTDPHFKNLDVLTESEISGNEVITRKLAVKYGKYLLLPDTDMAIVDVPFEDPWKSEVLAIVSCKTSLRERIAQACYWKLKLVSSDVTKNVKVFLATTDNDEDFGIRSNARESFNGRSRNRIIAEHELDGVYILRDDFRDEWESPKVKRYERIFDDLCKIFKRH